MRKLVLTSILGLIAPGSAGQVVVGFVLAFTMLLANLSIKPYADSGLNFINTTAQLNLVCFLFVALLLKVRAAPGAFANDDAHAPPPRLPPGQHGQRGRGGLFLVHRRHYERPSYRSANCASPSAVPALRCRR